MKNETLVLSHPQCLAHDPGYGHPESPQRLAAIIAKLKNYEEAPAATEQQILLAHDQQLFNLIRDSSPGQGLAQIDPDTFMSPASFEAVLHASGAASAGIDRLMQDKARHVFCATRPPGHHATRSQAMGFCLFNHIAIAACYAQQHYGLERIAIVDFDVHHGNGTQDILGQQQGMFYLSTHQSPFYPGTGLESENIPERILNIPLPAGTGHQEYIDIFSSRLLPALKAYKPELILVSAGFDAHHADPLASLELTSASYHWLGQQLANVAASHCQSRMLSTLEGGYNIRVLADSVQSYLQGVDEIFTYPAVSA